MWRLESVSPSGGVATEEFGNGMVSSRTFYPRSGSLWELAATSADSVELWRRIYAYDANGNLHKESDPLAPGPKPVTVFGYDELDRLTSVDRPWGADASLSYGDAGNIESKSGLGTYFYDGPQPHAVTAVSVPPTSYAYDANGNQTMRDELTLTGHEDELDLGWVNMRGRRYDPRVGRMLQVDPFVNSPYDPQSLNRYAYALNNPLRYVDPTGLLAEGMRPSAGAPEACEAYADLGCRTLGRCDPVAESAARSAFGRLHGPSALGVLGSVLCRRGEDGEAEALNQRYCQLTAHEGCRSECSETPFRVLMPSGS